MTGDPRPNERRICDCCGDRLPDEPGTRRYGGGDVVCDWCESRHYAIVTAGERLFQGEPVTVDSVGRAVRAKAGDFVFGMVAAEV